PAGTIYPHMRWDDSMALVIIAHFIIQFANAIHDREQFMCPFSVICHHGYPAERHEAVTDDGYILTLFRIPRGRGSPSSTSRRPAVLFQHGLLSSSWDAVSNLPDKALGFVLADAGFDVWMANSRGNIYSPGHLNLTSADAAYWQFSWYDMARYDMPAVIDKVLNHTGNDKLYLIGHSQGTLITFTSAVLNPILRDKITHFYALAPIVTAQNLRGFWLNTFVYFRDVIESITQSFEDAISSMPVLHPICGHIPLFFASCDFFMSDVVGPSTQVNQSRIPVFSAKFPAGTSKKNIIHWGQMTSKYGSRHFDEGLEGNLCKYGTLFPPPFSWTSFAIPTTLFYSSADHLANSEDVMNLLSILPKHSIMAAHNISDFNHSDFMWGERARTEIY
ncbi:hypothetical protein PENTCL1PPCAC_4318, partial [Pristionchus entomophagus]